MLEILSTINKSLNYTCGTGNITFSGIIPYITSIIVLIIKIGVPVLLIIFGMLDLGKAVIAQKDDEIKKGQGTFVKRLIAAIIVFFVVTIVQLVVNLVANEDTTITNCINCFISGENNENACTISTKENGSM